MTAGGAESDRRSGEHRSEALLDDYVAAWNAGDLDAWIGVHASDVEYVSLATGDARVFRGQEGLREVWRESRANWDRFELSIVDREGIVIEIAFSGRESMQGIEIGGVLWFRVEARDGRIARLWSALDAALLPG
ncbi:MAG: nuclear transport factor 2 family protein [Thermoleophilaceae bacterium]